jgi:hypothetical protein
MTLGTQFVADTPTIVAGGVTQEPSNAFLQAQFPGKTVTPSTSFAFVFKGTVVNFLNGVTQVVTPDLLAALTAASAPVFQP